MAVIVVAIVVVIIVVEVVQIVAIVVVEIVTHSSRFVVSLVELMVTSMAVTLHC